MPGKSACTVSHLFKRVPRNVRHYRHCDCIRDNYLKSLPISAWNISSLHRLSMKITAQFNLVWVDSVIMPFVQREVLCTHSLLSLLMLTRPHVVDY